jgi:hypothetical protein
MHVRKWGLAIALWLGTQVPGLAAPVQVVVDPRVELASLMAALTTWGRQSAPTPPSAYASETFTRFAPDAQHPSIVQLQEWLTSRKLSLELWTEAALHLTPTGGIALDDDPAWKSRAGDAPLQLALEAMSSFAADTRAMEWFESRKPTFASLDDRVMRVLETSGLAPRIERYTGAVPAYHEIVLAPLMPKESAQSVLLSTATASGPRVVVRALSVARDRGPEFFEGSPGFLRQVSRGWLRGLVASSLPVYEENLNLSQGLLAPIREDMTARGLSRWTDVVVEHLARAIDTRLLQESGDSRASVQALRAQERTGFAYIRECFDLMADYEGNRSTYPDLASFLPVIVDKFGVMQDTGVDQDVAKRIAFFQGPMDRAREPRFVARWTIVEPEIQDPALQRKVHQEIMTLQGVLRQRTGTEVPIVGPTAAAALDPRETAFFVVGTPWSNAYMQALMRHLPVKVSKGNLQVSGKQFIGEGLRFAASFANPYNPMLPMTLVTASEDSGIPGLIDLSTGPSDFIVLRGGTMVSQGDFQYDERNRWTLR